MFKLQNCVINLGQSKRKMNILEVLKENVNSLYVKYIKNDEIIEEPIFYIAGAQTLPPPLPEEEELFYIQKLSDDDNLEARQILIERNLRLVVYIAKKFENTGIGIEDLISIGTIGLAKGVNTFKADKNIKLATYASRCIENEILMYFRANKKNKKNISLNESIGFDKEGNEITFLDILKTPDPEYALSIHNDNNIKDLQKYMNILTKREREIIEKRYGLNDYEETTQKDIAKNLKISRSYVSRIEKRALTKMLREFLKNKSQI